MRLLVFNNLFNFNQVDNNQLINAHIEYLHVIHIITYNNYFSFYK